MAHSRGKVFVIIGPSGAGKTTLAQKLLADKQNADLIATVPSYTTRKIREGEQDGTDYHFISKSEFEQKINEGFFLEWSNAYKDYYGSSKKEIEDILNSGKSVLLVIDRLGAEEVKKILKNDAIIILILPPSRSILRKRLQKRGTESLENIEFRINQAEKEAKLEQVNPLADAVVENDDLESALEDLSAIIRQGA